MTTVSASLDFFRRRLRPWLELAGADPALTEIMYDGDGCMSVDIAGELRHAELAGLTDEDVVALGSNAAVYSDQVWSRERPFLSIIIPPDWRCSFVRPPVVERPVMSLRKLRRLPVPLQRYIDDGTMSATEAEYLRQLILARRTICISGEVGSGKTTLLRTLLGLVPSNERIVTLEDPRELMLTAPDGVFPRPHYVALEATLGVMGLDALLRASLRLRPDRIIVGEVRGPEALELVRSLNTGHRGAMFTLHSNGARQALERLHTLTFAAAALDLDHDVDGALHRGPRESGLSLDREAFPRSGRTSVPHLSIEHLNRPPIARPDDGSPCHEKRLASETRAARSRQQSECQAPQGRCAMR